MEVVLRNVFQFFGRNQIANRLAKKYGLRFGAQKFVAGESINKAIKAIDELNQFNLVATLDHLGEFVSNEKEATASTEMCIHTLEEIYNSGVNSNLSVKLTSLGLDISKDLCLKNMRKILHEAKKYGNFVRIDMEDYAHCEISIEIYKELKEEYDNVGLVLQAYLYRTKQDLEDLRNLHANLRLVKGAYKEPPEVAYPQKKDVDNNFKQIIKQNLLNGHYTAIATHDEDIIRDSIDFIKEKDISKDRFEFQMLYGICEDLQKQLVKMGYKVRVYVPFGEDWYGYFMRRLAERPANVGFVLRNLIK